MTRRDLTPDQQRFLDGAPHGALTDAARADADRLKGAIETWARGVEAPGAALDDAVMSRVGARRGQPAQRSGLLRWLVEPRPIRVRPVWVPALAAAAAVIVWLGLRQLAVPPAAPPTASAAPDTVFVRFELIAPEAHQVTLAGSFNGWRTEGAPLTREDGGIWTVTLPLSVGEHRYQFVVDGDRWMPDPKADAQVEDGFGGQNSVIVVGPRGVVRS
jgi:hypothetical protein